jgi:hypothetical protein
MTTAPDVPPLPPRRPLAVKRAVQLLCLTVALGAVSILAVFTLSGLPSFAALLVAILGVAITAFLIDKIGAGRAWARIVLLVLFGVGLIQFVFGAGEALERAPLLLLLGFVQHALEGLALYLVFTKPGDDWFGVA